MEQDEGEEESVGKVLGDWYSLRGPGSPLWASSDTPAPGLESADVGKRMCSGRLFMGPPSVHGDLGLTSVRALHPPVALLPEEDLKFANLVFWFPFASPAW